MLKGEDFFSVEIAVPFSTFGRAPEHNEVWKFNVGRNIALGSKDHTYRHYSWAPVVKRYCEPKRFARLVFRPRPALGKEVVVPSRTPSADDAELHLVVSLSFDEGYGNVAHGQSAVVNDGEIHGAQWSSGRIGGALKFEKEGDCVAVPHSESLKGIRDALTLTPACSPTLWTSRTAAPGGWVRPGPCTGR